MGRREEVNTAVLKWPETWSSISITSGLLFFCTWPEVSFAVFPSSNHFFFILVSSQPLIQHCWFYQAEVVKCWYMVYNRVCSSPLQLISRWRCPEIPCGQHVQLLRQADHHFEQIECFKNWLVLPENVLLRENAVKIMTKDHLSPTLAATA